MQIINCLYKHIKALDHLYITSEFVILVCIIFTKNSKSKVDRQL